MAEQNITFFVSIIRDVLLHTGFIADGKNETKVQARQFQIAQGKFDKLTKMAENLTKLQGQVN